MEETLRSATLLLATVANGLMAGLYSAFSYAVMPGLRRTGDRAMVGAMQGVNVAIVNPLFLCLFFGALLLPAAAAIFHLGRGGVWWIVAGTVLYLVTMVTTVAGNVPLNNALNDAGDPDRIADPAGARRAFEPRWTRLNHARSVAGVAAFACLAVALTRV